MKFRKVKKLKGLSVKSSEGVCRDGLSEKRIAKKSRFFKYLIPLCTLIIIPVLKFLPHEIVIFNSVTYQNIQTINVNYELDN